MGKVKRIVAGVALAIAATAAQAAPMRLRVTGTVDAISASQNQAAVAVPNGSVRVGDVYTLDATFDPARATLGSLYDADPTINIYYLPGTQVTITIGSYSRSFTPVYDFNASLQLWNNYVSGGSPVDNQTFSFFDYDIQKANQVPFDLGAGQKSASMTAYAFDFTATARSNDLISQIAPFSAFASRSFSYGLLNSDTNLFVFVGGSVASEALTAVPEPATWLAMAVGFGALGAVARRGRVAART